MSIIHTQPTQTAGIKERKLFQIASGASQVADSVPIADTISVKWFVSLRDIVTEDTCAYEVFATHNKNDADYNIHNVVGTKLNNNTTVMLMGGTHMVIQITNNNVNTIDIRICKHVLEL